MKAILRALLLIAVILVVFVGALQATQPALMPECEAVCPEDPIECSLSSQTCSCVFAPPPFPPYVTNCNEWCSFGCGS
jgi:hypothetical protein